MSNSILTHVYDNGLVLAAEPMRSLESAAFTFLTPAGCSHDPPGRLGLAGLTCEMAIRGAGPRDNRQFINDLENLGVERSESVGTAHASFSGATLARNLPKALVLYADLLRRPRLPAEELEPSRQVSLQELRAIEDEPSQKVMLELRRRQYPDPWGRFSEGDQAALEAISLDEIRAFYSRHYRPNQTILGVAGKIDWPALCDQVGALLGDWKSVDVPEPKRTPPPERIAHLPHDANQTQIGVAYDSVPYRHKDYFPAWGAVGVLSGGMSSRLFTEVREKRGLCYSVYASHHTLRDLASVLCYSGTSAERAQETLDVMIGELCRLAEGVEQAELDRLKARMKSALIMQQESSSSRSASIARDYYLLGKVRTLDEVGKLVDDLSCDEINAYLAANPPDNFAVVTLGPKALKMPNDEARMTNK